MRNGIVSDTLRKAGSPYRSISGLNLPQLAEIARETGRDETLAAILRADDHTRESQLMAPMLAERTRSLCLKLLRHIPDPVSTAIEWASSAPDAEHPLRQYAGVRLMWNLIPLHSAVIRPVASKVAESDGATAALASRLVEEIDFLAGA